MAESYAGNGCRPMLLAACQAGGRGLFKGSLMQDHLQNGKSAGYLNKKSIRGLTFSKSQCIIIGQKGA